MAREAACYSLAILVHLPSYEKVKEGIRLLTSNLIRSLSEGCRSLEAPHWALIACEGLQVAMRLHLEPELRTPVAGPLRAPGYVKVDVLSEDPLKILEVAESISYTARTQGLPIELSL